jgi:hypothetical protein
MNGFQGFAYFLDASCNALNSQKRRTHSQRLLPYAFHFGCEVGCISSD